jgi:hypothetical protein
LLGNAKVAGLSRDLHLKGLEYNIAAAVFFVRNMITSCLILKLNLIAQGFLCTVRGPQQYHSEASAAITME